jgi:hypothetical protein
MYSVALPAIVLSVVLFELSTSVLPKELVAGGDIGALSLHVIASALFLNHAWGLWWSRRSTCHTGRSAMRWRFTSFSITLFSWS